MSIELERTSARSRTSVSIVQGCRLGCLDDGGFLFNIEKPPSVNVVGIEDKEVVDDGRDEEKDRTIGW